MSFDQDRIDRLRKPGPVREIMEVAGANGYPPYVWFEVDDILNKYAASSSQGLTYRWEGEFLYIGNFAFARVYSSQGEWFVWLNGKRDDTPVASEKAGGEIANEKAKAFIKQLEGKE